MAQVRGQGPGADDWTPALGPAVQHPVKPVLIFAARPPPPPSLSSSAAAAEGSQQRHLQAFSVWIYITASDKPSASFSPPLFFTIFNICLIVMQQVHTVFIRD